MAAALRGSWVSVGSSEPGGLGALGRGGSWAHAASTLTRVRSTYVALGVDGPAAAGPLICCGDGGAAVIAWARGSGRASGRAG